MKSRTPDKIAKRLARRQASYDRLKAPKPTNLTRPGSQNPHKAAAEGHGKRKNGRA